MMNIIIGLIIFMLGVGSGVVLFSLMAINNSSKAYKKGYNDGKLNERKRLIESINQIYGVNKQPGLQDTDEVKKEVAE